MKAWHSLKRAVEKVYGTWEDSVTRMPAYMGALQKWNPGTVVEWYHCTNQVDTNHYTIGWVFWAFKPSIDAYQYCRGVISVDGTHLYTKYKHKLLVAVIVDANHHVVPVAFAIVDDEHQGSWAWFLSKITQHIVRGRKDNCLISDRHPGLLAVVHSFPEFNPPHGVYR